MTDTATTEWLLGGDAAVRHQVLRDLVGAPAVEVAAERARIPHDGAAAALLALQRTDGQWGVGVYDADDWLSTTDALWLLREVGCVEGAEVDRAIELVVDRVRWEPQNGGAAFFDGETEACVNGRVLALGAAFGRVSARLLDRLLDEQLPDGGWNCEAPHSTRSSFHSTICVLEGLREAGAALDREAEVSEAVRHGAEFLLERRLLRSRSTGRLLDDAWLAAHVPAYWCYDVLRGLEFLRVAGLLGDPRAAEAIDVLRAARSPEGRWSAAPLPGRSLVDLEPAGPESRWVTLRALRVLAAV